MSKIYKYPLQITDEQVINIPNIAHPLSVQVQESEGGMPVLWVMTDDANPFKGINIYIIGTGQEFSQVTGGTHKTYLSTFQQGSFVGHVFYAMEFNC